MKERQIQIFRAVMNYGGINRAAEMLNISQPAASRMIAALEAETSLVLFVRNGRTVSPTPEAYQLKAEVDTYFIGLDRVAKAADDIRALRRGHLRLTVMPAVALSLAPGVLSQVSKRYPDITTTLDVHTSPRILDLIATGQYDMGICHHAVSRPEIEELLAWRVDCVCVMRRDHALSSCEVLEPKDLAATPMISLSHGTDTSIWMRQAFQAAGVRPVVRVEAQPSYAACALAVEGLGVTIVDAMTAEFFCSDDVVTIPFSAKVPFEFKLIKPARKALSVLAAEFVQICEQSLQEYSLASRDI